LGRGALCIGTVDTAYRAQLPPGMTAKPKFDTEAQRVAFLFVLYRHLSELTESAAE